MMTMVGKNESRRKVRVDPELRLYLTALCRIWGLSFDEALRRAWEADEFIIVAGLARFIRPSKPDGRIAG